MNKKVVMLGMVVGSTIGSYIPVMCGASGISFSSIFGAFVGGALGIWLTFRLFD